VKERETLGFRELPKLPTRSKNVYQRLRLWRLTSLVLFLLLLISIMVNIS
jgi:hypothetical protein